MLARVRVFRVQYRDFNHANGFLLVFHNFWKILIVWEVKREAAGRLSNVRAK